MAKHKVVEPVESEMTVVMFKLRGSDATLQEGLRALNSGLAAILPQAVVQRRAVGLSGPVLANANESQVNEATVVDSDEDSVLELSSVTTSAPSNRTAKRSLRSPVIIDLDLVSGDMPLVKFFSEHPVDHVAKRYLLIAYWFKAYRSIDAISIDHVHTAYRTMGWQTPRDAAQPLRDMKSKSGWFHKGEKGYYKINHVGENEVLKILGSK